MSAVRALALNPMQCAQVSSWTAGVATPAAAPVPHVEEEREEVGWASVESERSLCPDPGGESATGPMGREELKLKRASAPPGMSLSVVAAQRFSAAKAGWRLPHGHGRASAAVADYVAAELSAEDLSTAGVGTGPESSFEHV